MKRWWTTSWRTVGVFIAPATVGRDSGGIPGRRVSLRPFAGAPLVSSQPGGRPRQAVFRFYLRPRPKDRRTRDLRGGARANRRFVGWQTFFDFGDGEVKPRKRIDTRISTPLFNLPLRAIASGDPPTSLAQRNLLRHQTWELPSGQRIANAMRLPVARPQDLGELAGYGLGLERSTPLWYYILKEADLIGAASTSVPWAVASSARCCSASSRPTAIRFCGRNPTGHRRCRHLPAPETSGWSIFLKFAGVDPASRGQ